MPFATFSDNNNQPDHPRTHRDLVRFTTSQINSSPREFVRRQAEELSKMSVDEYISAILHHTKEISSGIDKSRPFPILANNSKHNDPTINYENRHREPSLTSSSIVTIDLNDGSWCAFNTKNLVKHYQYPIVEAKRFYKNVMTEFTERRRIAHPSFSMPKNPKAQPFFANAIFYNGCRDVLYSWAFSHSKQIEHGLDTGVFTRADFVNNIKEAKIPNIPVSSWKQIAQSCYERNHPGKLWEDLTLNSQSRRTVNSIRHNSLGYIDYWLHRDHGAMSTSHDAIFEEVMRKILNSYPSLAEECRRQMNERLD